MQHLVQFRLNVNALSQSEYQTLINSIDKGHIIRALFDYHLKQLQNNECQEVIALNQKISEIMNARNVYTSDAIQNASLNNIAIPLINYIDSYLDNNLHFQRVCRTIYMASKAPQNIHKIDPEQIKKYINYCKANNETIDVKKFDRVNHLNLRYQSAVQLWNDTGFIASNVTRLTVDCEQNELQALISLNRIQLSRVNALELWQTYEGKGDVSIIIDQTPNIQYLYLIRCDEGEINVESITEQTKNILQQLIVLRVEHCNERLIPNDNNALFIDLCGAQLRVLDTDISLSMISTVKKFVNLEELSIPLKFDCDLAQIISIIENFTKLKAIRLTFVFGWLNWDSTESLNRNEMSAFLDTLMNINSLELIKFQITAKGFGFICDTLQQSLVTTHKNKLKVSIEIFGESGKELVTQKMDIGCISLVNALQSAVKNDFMFHLKVCHWRIENINDLKENMQKWLDRSKRKFRVEYDFHEARICDGIRFVICNKESKINGYAEMQMRYFEKWATIF